MNMDQATSPFVIDKKTYKLVKYVYRRKMVSVQQLLKKGYTFDDITTLAWLCEEKYAAYKPPAKRLTFTVPKPEPDGCFGLTPLGKKYVEDSINTSFKWILPAILSFLSIAISFSTLLLTLFGKSELWIHLMK